MTSLTSLIAAFELIPVLIFAGVAIAIVVGIWYASVVEKKRTEILSMVAGELGLVFSAEADPILLQKLERFPTFSRGRRRIMKNVMTAETDHVRLAIFDYQFTTGSGKNSHTHRFSVAAIESERLQLPQFQVRPEHFFDRIGSALGFQDIDFDEHPEFSESFVLQGENESAIRSFFDKRVMDLFVSRKDALVDGGGNLTAFRRHGRQSPEKMSEFMADAYEFLNAFHGPTDSTEA